jgi:glycosyltransferase involved in cell wall biosynthesis
MRIAINVEILRRQLVGVVRYTYQLISGLSSVLEPDDALLLVNNSYKRGNIQHPSLPPGLSNKCIYKNIVVSRKLLKIFQSTFGLPRLEWLIGKFDVFHSTWLDPAVQGIYPFPPTKAARVITVHDTAFYKINAGFYEPDFIEKIDAYMRNGTSIADAILVDSDCTRCDVMEHLGVPENKIFRVYLAADPRFHPLDDAETVSKTCAQFSSERPFFLFTGTLAKNKNVANIIRAFEIFQSRCSEEFRLVLCGGNGWRHEEILDAAMKSKYQRQIVFTGYLNDDLLPILMNGATGFVFPSFYEGFGLPALEAMSCGTPVITSNTSSLPEIVGDAGLLVSPNDIEAIAHAMFRLADDIALRKQLGEKSLIQSAKFSWERCARETLAVYRNVIN